MTSIAQQPLATRSLGSHLGSLRTYGSAIGGDEATEGSGVGSDLTIWHKCEPLGPRRDRSIAVSFSGDNQLKLAIQTI